MTIIILIKKILLIILFIFIEKPLFMVFFTIILWFFSFYLLKEFSKKKWHIADLKIETVAQGIFVAFWCMIYIVIFIIIFSVLRIKNMGREIDLIMLYKDITDFILNNTLIALIGYLIFILSCILLVLIFFMFVSQTLFKSFLKLHYYLVYYSLKNNKEENKENITYIKTTVLIENFITKITLFPFIILNPFINERKSGEYTSYSFKLHVKSHTLAPYWGFILLLSFLFYDIIFNNCIIHKVFYILPIVFLYQLLLFIKNFLFKATCFQKDIACFLYVNVKFVDTETIYYENNFETEAENFTLITDYIARGYKPKLRNK